MTDPDEGMYLLLNNSCGQQLEPTQLPSCAGNISDVEDPYAQFYETSQFVTGIILYPIIIIIGVTGNILTLIVLSHRKMLTSTNVFLTALAVSDIIKLINDTLYFLVSILLRRHPLAGNRMLGYMYPFSHYIFNEAVCVSAWLTVSVAVERYISICHATQARVVCSIHRAKIISAVVFFVMSLVAVPSAFRYTRATEFDTAKNITMFKIEPSALGRNKSFMIVYTWIQNLLRSIIPLFVLILLNAFIIQALRKERIKGKQMSSRNRITLMLIVVILVFIVCIFPDAIMSTVFGFGYVDESNLVKGIREFTDSLLSLNSAVNFMIYCLCSKSFRDVFNEIFCNKCISQEQLYSRVRSKVPSIKDNSPTHSQHRCNGEVAMEKEESSCLVSMPTERTNVVGNGHQVSVYTGPQTYL